MKYTFKALPLAALSMAALLFSFTDSKASFPDVSEDLDVGNVTCYINPEKTLVSLRRYINYVQISQQFIPIFDEGFGLEKQIEVVKNYCLATTIELCKYHYWITPMSTSTLTGNLIHGSFVKKCQYNHGQ
jgi:hypothetical protein